MAAIVLGFLCAGAVQAQTLELGGTREPKLGEDTYAAVLIEQLTLEIAERDDLARTARGMIRPAVLRASANYRRIASDLLQHADSGVSSKHVAFVMGLTLFEGREEIDDALRSLATMLSAVSEESELPHDDITPMRAAQSVRLFNEKWKPLKDQLTDGSVEELDIVIAQMLMPLCEAVMMIEGSRLMRHWPEIDGGIGALRVDDTGAITRGIEAISLRATDAAISPECAVALAEITGYLQSGSTLAELRPRIRQYTSLILDALSFAATVNQVDWLNVDDRAALQNEIEALIALFREQSTRGNAIKAIERIQWSRETLEVLSELGQVKARRANMKPLGIAFLALHKKLQSEGDAGQVQDQLRTLKAIAQHMLDFRSLGGLELRGELRKAAMKLERNYDDAEQALLGELDLLVDDPGAMSNPAFNSVFNQHRQYLEDLRRVRQLPDWVDAIESIRPRAAPGFARQTNKMAAWLIEPARRQSAVLAMDQFDRQWSTFRTMPLEDAIKASDQEVEALVGGQGTALLELIDSQRAEWADAWAAGDAGSDAARRLALIAKLLQMAEDFRGLAQLNGDASATMNAWAAWEITPLAATGMLDESPGRVVLGVQSAIAGNDADLDRQVNLITREMTVARLAGRICLVMQTHLAALPGGAIGTLGQVVVLPQDDSFMRANRSKLAQLCRYRAERMNAESHGDDYFASRCDQYVNSLAEAMLRALGERVLAVPTTLTGFDGSDPG